MRDRSGGKQRNKFVFIRRNRYGDIFSYGKRRSVVIEFDSIVPGVQGKVEDQTDRGFVFGGRGDRIFVYMRNDRLRRYGFRAAVHKKRPFCIKRSFD